MGCVLMRRSDKLCILASTSSVRPPPIFVGFIERLPKNEMSAIAAHPRVL